MVNTDVATESDTESDTDEEEIRQKLQVQSNTLPPTTTLKVDKPLSSPPPPEYTSLWGSNEVAYTEIVKIQRIDVNPP